MRTAFSMVMILAVFSSCLKNEGPDSGGVVDPPFERYQYFWRETDKRIGSGNWEPVSSGNVLRLYSDDLDTVGIMIGLYEYNSVNAEIDIPENYYFAKDDDSLHFCRPISSNPSSPAEYVTDTLASVGYERQNDSSMVIRNNSVTPAIEIRYSKW